MSTSFEFISADGNGQLKPVDRSRIRSRCLQGRNKRVDSRRSQREARKRVTSTRGLIQGPSVPLPPPANVAVLLPNDIGSESRETLYKLFSCKSLEHFMLQLADYVSFSPVETTSFEQLFYDAAFSQGLVTFGSMINDFNLHNNQKLGSKTYKHLRKTIRILNDRLNLEDAHDSDSILYAILTLTMMAAWSGDWRSVSAHIAGLHKIVQLRGGLEYLVQRPKLHFKLDRVDLVWVLSTGEQPLFAPNNVCWDPIFSDHQVPTRYRAIAEAIKVRIDKRVAAIFQDLQTLTNTFTLHAQNQTKWEAHSFQSVVNSIQTRLLSLPKAPMDLLSESLRLGMLAFLATMSRMPGRQITLSFLGGRFRVLFQSCEKTKARTLCATVLQWALMMAILCAAVNADEDWVTEAWTENSHALVPEPWGQFQQQLRSIMWINSMHEESGRTVFVKLCTQMYGADLNPLSSCESSRLPRGRVSLEISNGSNVL